MRELTQSMVSLAWAMSLLGVEQATNLIAPRRASTAFGAVARAAEDLLGPTLHSAFQSGDRLQRAVVDASFALVGLGPAPDGGNAVLEVAAPGDGTGPAGAPAAGGSGLLNQVGDLAFGLLQVGVDTVYWLSGTAWQQQQGFVRWGPVQPPDVSRRR